MNQLPPSQTESLPTPRDRRRTLPLPTELICQILSDLDLYDCRSFGLCSRDSYRIVVGELFNDVILGKTAGTSIVADIILRGGKQTGRLRKRAWNSRLSTTSLLALKHKGYLMGDFEFLMNNGRIAQRLRKLHIGLPTTPAWNIFPSASDTSASNKLKVNPELIEDCLYNLPNLRSVSIYAPTPYESDYQGLDLRVFHYAVSNFNVGSEFSVAWWPHFDPRRFHEKGDNPFVLPNGSQLFPNGQTDDLPQHMMDLNLYGAPSASSISLNLLCADYPLPTIIGNVYTPRRTWLYTNPGRTYKEQRLFESLLPRMIYSLLLPSCIARTLTTLELKLDTCPCCCIGTNDTREYRSLIEEVSDRMLPLGFSVDVENIKDDEQDDNEENEEKEKKVSEHRKKGILPPEKLYRRFNFKDFSMAPLVSFSYLGPPCKRSRSSWLSHAAETWGNTLETLSIVEVMNPHAGAERGEKYGRNPVDWDVGAYLPAFLRLKNLRHLTLGHGHQGDKRDAGYLIACYEEFDDDGERRNGEEGLSGTVFANGGNSVLNAISHAVMGRVAAAAAAVRSSEAEEITRANRTEQQPEDSSAPSSGSSTPTAQATPLEAGVSAFYRAGRRRRVREAKKFVRYMPMLQRLEWVMHGAYAVHEEGEGDDEDPSDVISDDPQEIALAETVAVGFKVSRSSKVGDDGEWEQDIEIVADSDVESQVGSGVI